MDEIDHIIIHTLRQIGCNIDDEIISLSSFSPDLLVDSISKCINLIKPALNPPNTLPSSMAQRFNATVALAEAVTAIGFRGDIGYQTFLYSNTTEVRRVFMFLIEMLPKEVDKTSATQPFDKMNSLENELAISIYIQLNQPWVPQYCNKSGIRRYKSGVLCINAELSVFHPQINFNIPKTTSSGDVSSELVDYWIKRSPGLFQQTDSLTSCATIIHQNDLDLVAFDRSESFKKVLKALKLSKKRKNSSSAVVDQSDFNKISALNPSKLIDEICDSSDYTKQEHKIHLNKPENILDEYSNEVENLNISINQLLSNRKVLQKLKQNLKEESESYDKLLQVLEKERKTKERTSILLEDPQNSIAKMELIMKSSKNKLNVLEKQWKEHSDPLKAKIQNLTDKNSDKYSQHELLMEQTNNCRQKYNEVVEDLKMKKAIFSKLSNDFEKVHKTVSRKAYTTRILEIIGNIRKQKSDIEKVLRDTRELQKDINNVTGQLERQFTVTDDLLYKTAKRDEYSKKAYKLLASLHTNCKQLVLLVQETGAVMREIRDIEDQIEIEKARNISSNLENITRDIKQMENESQQILCRIRKAENQIT